MKAIIALTLVVLSNGASANGFSPWNEIERVAEQNVSAITTINDAGFGPWRDRVIADEIRLNPQTDVVAAKHGEHVFSPWS